MDYSIRNMFICETNKLLAVRRINKKNKILNNIEIQKSLIYNKIKPESKINDYSYVSEDNIKIDKSGEEYINFVATERHEYSV